MRPDGWYPDPGKAHELRYLDHEQWTAFVSDHGFVAQEPLTPRRRRRWPWVVGSLVAVSALVLGTVFTLGLVGLDRQLDELDVYTQDLTTDHSGFPTSTSEETVRAWTSDGYRQQVLVPITVSAAGMMSPTPHTVLAFKVDVVPEDVPVGAEFGVQCWQSETRGYGLLVSSDGAARLVAGSVPARGLETLSTATVEPLRAGEPRTLTVSCSVVGDEALIAGYVDGVRVMTAATPNWLNEITAGGVVVRTGTEAPATWTVTRFERMGVHNMPEGWRG